MIQTAWLIPIFPLVAMAAIVLFTHRHRALSAGISIAAVSLSFLWGWSVAVSVWGDPTVHRMSFDWLNLGESMYIPIGIQIDGLTGMMLVVVTTVALMVQIYSLGYMRDDPRYSRYYAYLSLFTMAMLTLVLADNFFLMFVSWELVGLASYLLIGFWFEKQSAADAGKKAFITTRLGDLGFILGLLLLYTGCGTLTFQGVFSAVDSHVLSGGLLTIAGLCLFAGAVGKSAQVPLHVWLPDAMEGPTPVSALIHAATMVVAGVYLVARSMSIFLAADRAAMVVAWIGIITSVMAASIGLVQNDIKRVLAYSTVSQLGYMIMALGLGGFTAGTFHLMTHAFFKALLFLGAGSVIHAVHTNDIREMGGLHAKMKTTSITFLIAALAIAGVFPLSGFWSKDEIVAATLGHPIFTVLTLAVAFMTAFYMFRLYFLTFTGKPRDQHKFDHAHESPKTMTVPLQILAVLSVVSGWIGLPWLEHGFSSVVFHEHPHHPEFHVVWAFIAALVGLSGIGLAYMMYYKGSIDPERVRARATGLYTTLLNKYYFDEAYSVLFVRPYYTMCRGWFWFDQHAIDGAVNGLGRVSVAWSVFNRWFDETFVDGAVNGVGWLTRGFGAIVRHLQTGRVQNYAFIVFAALVVLWLLQ
ncbi:MAG: NADH-quinone oxidoreductase subunit L [candidate division Zixibacteria bacterium]|nr:NADH-quinone oxidoreductase subunit L [candidate division Zixibacteria bacterium]